MLFIGAILLFSLSSVRVLSSCAASRSSESLSGELRDTVDKNWPF